MPRMILPPDAFDDIPEGYLHSAEPDDDDRDEPTFREYDDYAERVALDSRHEREERFAGLLAMAEERIAA